MGRRSRSRSRDRGRRRSRSRSRSSDSSDSGGFRVHVGELGIDCSRRELEKTFEKFGPLYEVWLAQNPPCFAFIKFRHKEDAEEAIEKMNGQVVCGSRVKVDHALPRTRGHRRRSFDPNLRCYTCGDRGHFSRDCSEILSNKGYTASFRARSPTPEWRYGRRRSRSGSRSRQRHRSRSREKKKSRSKSRDRRDKRDKSQDRSRDRNRSRDRSKDREDKRRRSDSSRHSDRHDKKDRRKTSTEGADKGKSLVADYDESQHK